MIRQRVAEMREPPLGLDRCPHDGLATLMDELLHAPTGELFVFGTYGVLVPAMLETLLRLQQEAHPLADAPTVRMAKLIRFEIEELDRYGKAAMEALANGVDPTERKAFEDWLKLALLSAQGLDGKAPSDVLPPAPRYAIKPFQIDPEPARDDRFIDRFNAGVNPEAFLYDEKYRPRDKTLMMYYKRLRELDVPEMMATILQELNSEEPWEFHREMIRQLWDEARHAMMGEVGFASLGIDWTKIPINFTWSRNLNMQLNARERHGVLFFIEQGLMPRNGKRFEWEVGQESGDPLSALFQDFDWADEVLHSQIGRRWYVPKFSSLQEALAYGDACWSRVLSHWKEYRDSGLTQHRNWWPELYREACERWGEEPDAAALSFAVSYQDLRADLKEIES